MPMRRAAPRMAAFGALAGALMLMGGPALASTGTGAQNPALTVTLTVGTFGVEVEYVDDHGQRARSATARRSPRPRRPPCPPGPPAPAGCRSGGPPAGYPVVPGPGCRPPRPWRHRSHWWPPPPASGRERWSRINCSIHGFQGILHDQARPVAAYSQPVGLAGRRSSRRSPATTTRPARSCFEAAPSLSHPRRQSGVEPRDFGASTIRQRYGPDSRRILGAGSCASGHVGVPSSRDPRLR
jgi:hypothetical protein